VRVKRGESSVLLEAAALRSGAPLAGEGEEVRLEVCLPEENAAREAALRGLGFAQEEDVLDTWFSSALWPFSTLGWPDPRTAPVDPGQSPLGAAEGGGDDCLSYYYPGSCLVTARDIITLWVARMVLAGLHSLGDVPFSDVFIHANILDGKGERMSKTKGNGIDPVDIIEAYGTDAMRYVLCDMQTGTQDIRLPVTAVCPSCGHPNDLAATPHGRSVFTYHCGRTGEGGKRLEGCGVEFDVLGTIPELPSAKLISQRFDTGRAFCTKLWNSARFAFMHLDEVPTVARRREELGLEDRWILDGLNQTVLGVNRALSEYNPSAALGAAREFFWSSLCDWYLELVKPRLQDPADPTGPVARQVLAYCLDQVLRLLHPFVPFITEHLHGRLGERVPVRTLGELASAPPSELLITAAWPEPNPLLDDPALRAAFADLQTITRAVREVRAARGLPPKQVLEVTLRPPAERAAAIEESAHVVTRLAGIGRLEVDPFAARRPGSASKVLGDLQIFVHGVIDDAAERQRLEEARAKTVKEIAACEKKLQNPSFVARAPAEVVEEQRARLAGYRASLEAIEASLAELES
jgi:valyl-tRNA synthetase